MNFRWRDIKHDDIIEVYCIVWRRMGQVLHAVISLDLSIKISQGRAAGLGSVMELGCLHIDNFCALDAMLD